MFKVKKDPSIEDLEVPFLREKVIFLGITLGKKVSISPFLINKKVPFLDKNELLFKVEKDPQFEDSEVPFLRQKRYHFRYHFGKKGIILGIILGKRYHFYRFLLIKMYLFWRKMS